MPIFDRDDRCDGRVLTLTEMIHFDSDSRTIKSPGGGRINQVSASYAISLYPIASVRLIVMMTTTASIVLSIHPSHPLASNDDTMAAGLKSKLC